MKKKVQLIIVASLIVSFVLTSAVLVFGTSGTKRMTVYSEVIKQGNYAYCAARKGLYRVDLNNGEVKRFVKCGDYFYIDCMKLYKGYIYYLNGGDLNKSLCRISVNGKKEKGLASVISYSIKKNKIYYTTYNGKTDKVDKKCMSLNGKNKKKSPYKVKGSCKKSNIQGYRVKKIVVDSERNYDDEDDLIQITDHIKEFLETPDREQIELCSYTDQYYDF